MKIGEQLKRHRDDAMLTQEELGKRAGLSGFTISRIESNQVEPRVSTMRKIARALGIEPEELTARPKESWRSWEEFLEEKTGHAHLAGDRDEIADFLRGAESVEEHKEHRRLLSEEVFALDEEKKKSSAWTEMEIGGVPYMEIRMRHTFAILVSSGVDAITAEKAARALATA